MVACNCSCLTNVFEKTLVKIKYFGENVHENKYFPKIYKNLVSSKYFQKRSLLYMLLRCFITSRQVPTGSPGEARCLACFPMLPHGFQMQAPFSLFAFIFSSVSIFGFHPSKWRKGYIILFVIIDSKVYSRWLMEGATLAAAVHMQWLPQYWSMLSLVRGSKLRSSLWYGLHLNKEDHKDLRSVSFQL